MYQNIFYNKDTKAIHLWDDTKGYSKFPYQKYGYIRDTDGNFTTLDNHKVKKVIYWTTEDERDGKIS